MVIALTAACVFGFWRFATRSEAFRITAIRVPADGSVEVPEGLIGRNLWMVDLDKLAATLRTTHPNLKRLRVIRRLPNALEIEVLTRSPTAQLRLRQWHAVDRDGFILSEGRPTPWENLTLLTGLTPDQPPLKAGSENASQRLHEALRILAHLRRAPALTGHRLTAVDVSDPKHVTFVLDDELEVRCGSLQEFETHLTRLRTVLHHIARQDVAIRYIDVRFNEPVISPKT